MWWQQWLTQVLSHLVPYRRWKIEFRPLRIGDIVLVNYDRKLKKPEYKLAKILDVHPDGHGIVRTVTVGLRRSNVREKSLPYVGKPLERMKIGVQRLAVVCPIEEQILADGGNQVADRHGDAESVVGGLAIGDGTVAGNDDDMVNDDGLRMN